MSPRSHIEGRLLWKAPGITVVQASFRHFAFPRHVHATYSMGLVERGVNRFDWGGSRDAAPAGSLCVVNPDQAHTGEADAEVGWAYVNIYVDQRELARITGLRDPTALLYFPSAVITNARVVKPMRRLAALLRSGTADALEREHQFAVAIEALATEATSKPRALALTSAKLKRAKSLLEATVDRPLTLRELSLELQLGPSQIIRAFKEAFGISPYAYHLSHRVAEAQRRLADGASVADVAVATGFSDQAHLTRHFRAHMGFTPGRYARADRD